MHDNFQPDNLQPQTRQPNLYTLHPTPYTLTVRALYTTRHVTMIFLHYREGKKLPAEGGHEDDGYLLLLVSDVEQGKLSRSWLQVFDAALITAGPVAQVGLFSCLNSKPET
jgi:hypothetical protein